MKKIISIMLAVILMLNLAIPGFAAENDYIEITSKSAPLRQGPGKDYEEIVKLHQGDSLELLGYKTNKHGNDWFRVSFGETVGYVYCEHAQKAHKCVYEFVADGFSVCKCGEYILDNDSPILRTDAAVAAAGSLLPPAVAVAAGELTALGNAIGAAASAAFPYIAVAAVGGMLVYMAVSASGRQVKDVQRIESIEDVKKLAKEKDLNLYFGAALAPGETPALLITTGGMDLKEATEYLEKITDSRANAFIADITGKSLINIWTFTDVTARTLCDNFTLKNKDYTYGNSQKDIGKYEHDRNYKEDKIYFDHFHIFLQKGDFSLKKVKKIHILFGEPLTKADFA